MPNLVVACMFNYPTVAIMSGGASLREETIKRLEMTLPQCSTTSQSPKQEPHKFEFKSAPPHWYFAMPNQWCDHVSRSLLFLAIVEALEAEDWQMRASHACTNDCSVAKSTDGDSDTTRLFFWRQG